MRAANLAALCVAVTGLLASCSDGGNIIVNATGTVVVGAYVDLNANGQFEPTVDGNAAGVHITLSPWAGGAPAATGTTTTGGVLVLPAVPVGRYHVNVDTTSIGDTLQAELQTAEVTVSANDTAAVLVPLTYPRRTIAQARQLALGRRVLVQAVALTGSATFPDTTGQIADSTGTIRLVRIFSGGFQAGDTVRVLAARGSRDGQPTLTDARVYAVKSGDHPSPQLVTAATAATASGGTLDAALVRVAGTTILNAQQLSTGDAVLTVTDTSGTLQVYVDRTTGPITDPLAAGAILDVTGVLVPTPGAATWRVRPRMGSDLAAHFPIVTTAQARLLEPGRPVAIIGVALNGSASFNDVSVHIADATGALRALPVSPTVFRGDSIRLVGTIAIQNGQPTLSSATATVLGIGHPPAPVDLTTAVAATADARSRDAALVRVRAARIDTVTATGSGGFTLSVNDGSGRLRVLLDPRASSWQASMLVPGSSFDFTGLLVPEASGATWALKPRAAEDLVQR